jgi:cell division protein FtsL
MVALTVAPGVAQCAPKVKASSQIEGKWQITFFAIQYNRVLSCRQDTRGKLNSVLPLTSTTQEKTMWKVLVRLSNALSVLILAGVIFYAIWEFRQVVRNHDQALQIHEDLLVLNAKIQEGQQKKISALEQQIRIIEFRYEQRIYREKLQNQQQDRGLQFLDPWLKPAPLPPKKDD